jgi:hypothetical protein
MRGGLVDRFLHVPQFAEIACTDLETGQHRDPHGRKSWFTSAYSHPPEELSDEVTEAGFTEVTVIGGEGLAGWMPDLDHRLAHDEEQLALLDVLARIESESSIIGTSAHELAHAKTPS